MDALGPGRSEREVRKWEKCSCPERENSFSPPSSLLLGQGKMQGLEEDQMMLWEKA